MRKSFAATQSGPPVAAQLVQIVKAATTAASNARNVIFTAVSDKHSVYNCVVTDDGNYDAKLTVQTDIPYLLVVDLTQSPVDEDVSTTQTAPITSNTQNN